MLRPLKPAREFYKLPEAETSQPVGVKVICCDRGRGGVPSGCFLSARVLGSPASSAARRELPRFISLQLMFTRAIVRPPAPNFSGGLDHRPSVRPITSARWNSMKLIAQRWNDAD